MSPSRCRTRTKRLAQYTLGEEIANSVTHGIGWLLSAGGVGLLVTLAALTGGAMRVVSVSVFGVTLVLLYAASTMYHALVNERAKKVFKVLDHSAIYLLIAGTYTPLALVRLGGVRGWVLFSVIWFLAVVGVMITALGLDGLRWLAVTLYVAMGWSVVVVMKPLINAMGIVELVLLIVGGLCYTLGLIFYGWRRLPYGHMVWHLFVLAGSVLHFIAIVFAVALP